MSYTGTNWVDEIPATTPVKYRVKDNSDQILHDNVTIEVVTSVTPGTPLNASTLNKIETGIEDAHVAAGLAQIAADNAQDTADKGLIAYNWRDEPVVLTMNGNVPLAGTDKAYWMVTDNQKHAGGIQLVKVGAACLDGSSSGDVVITLKKYIRATSTTVNLLTTNISMVVGAVDTINAIVMAQIDEAKSNFVIGDKIIAEVVSAGTSVSYCQVFCVFRPIEV